MQSIPSVISFVVSISYFLVLYYTLYHILPTLLPPLPLPPASKVIRIHKAPLKFTSARLTFPCALIYLNVLRERREGSPLDLWEALSAVIKACVEGQTYVEGQACDPQTSLAFPRTRLCIFMYKNILRQLLYHSSPFFTHSFSSTSLTSNK